MSASLRGFLRSCRRLVCARVEGCRGLDELVRVLHLVLGEALLLSNSVRRGSCVVVEAEYAGKPLTVAARGDRVRWLSPDYYAGRGLVGTLLRRGRGPGLLVLPGPSGLKGCISLGCSEGWAYLIAYLNIALDRLGVPS